MTVDRNPESYFRGNDLVPFIGCVENIDDPMQIGRVQVRAISFHPELADGGVPTEHLPWAYVSLPTTASGVSGIGSTHGLIDGSWVFGFFLDGRDAQQPFILSSFVGAPGLSPLQKEFLNSNLAIPSMGPGGLSSDFQTIAAKAVGGLGNATKFGATVGGLMSIANLLKNDDAVKALSQVMGLGPTGKISPKIAKVIDVATTASIQAGASAAAGAISPGLGLAAMTNLPQVVMGMFSAGGAKGIPQGVGGSPMSGASFGTTASPGQEVNASNMTVDVKIDYDLLADSASDDVGALTITGSNTPKSKRYTIEALISDAKSKTNGDGKVGAHLVIDQTGQVIKTRDLTEVGTHTSGMNSVAVGGQSMKNIGIMLIGGMSSRDERDTPLNSKYFPVQLATLEKLVGAFVRKFPKIVVTGQNEINSTSSPGFNVSDWAAAKWPENVNSTDSGVKKLSGTGTTTVGAAVLDPSNLSTVGSGAGGDNPQDPVTLNANKRGFQGGPSHPLPSYSSKQQSDVPAMARANLLTNGGSGPARVAPASGGPASQYKAKIEEPSMHTFPKARPAHTLEARSVPGRWQPMNIPHGGEYGQAHVVRSTEGGHHILMDDTAGRQKVEIMHSTGSSLTIQADGSGQFYVKKDSVEVVIGDKKIGVNGGFTLSVGGDMNVMVTGDLNYDVRGKVSFNVGGGMTELVSGDRSTITEGSHLFQAKKNAVHRVGKDMSQQVGGKMATAVKGTKFSTTEGNSSDTVRGESTEFVGGNKSSLTLGASTEHAQYKVTESQKEIIEVAGGNIMMSAKGRGTLVAAGAVLVQSQASSSFISGGQTNITSGGRVNMNAVGNIDADGAEIEMNSGLSSAVTGTAPSDVAAPPAQLAREGNPADSNANLNAEQSVFGQDDANNAEDSAGESGTSGTGGAAGGLNSGGAAGSSSPTYAEATGQAVPSVPLGNYKQGACEIANDLVAKGWSKEGASGLVGHMITESRLNSGIINPNDRGMPAGGLAQWRAGRLTGLQSYAASKGLDWKTRQAQIEWIDHEARTTERGAGSKMINAKSMEEGILGGAEYERFTGWDKPFTGGVWGTRAGQGLGVYNECFGGNVQSVGGQSAVGIEGYTGGGSGGSASGGGGSSGGGGGGGGGGGDATTVDNGLNHQGNSNGVKGPYADGGGGAVDYSQRISTNYKLGQLVLHANNNIVPGSNPTPTGTMSSDEIIRNLSAVAVNVLEPILSAFGRVTITSGFRSLSYNRALRRASILRNGGRSGVAVNSDHQYGKAVDISVPGVSNRALHAWILKNLPNISKLGLYSGWVHVSFDRNGNGGRIARWG